MQKADCKKLNCKRQTAKRLNLTCGKPSGSDPEVEKGELFYAGIFTNRKSIIRVGGNRIIGIVSKLITRSLYKRLLKETDNMAMTRNKNLQNLKASGWKIPAAWVRTS